MTCPEVRDRLAEHALGVLPADEAGAIERHLGWCGGCRHELRELQEGLVTVAMALPQAEPPPSLEDRVVDRVRATAGRRHRAPRRRMRVLLAATLAATLAAVGAMGWAVAERRQVADVQAELAESEGRIEDLRDDFQELVDRFGGKLAELSPTGGSRGTGLVIILHAAGQPDRVFVEVFLPSYQNAPFTVRLLDRLGQTVLTRQLVTGNNRTLVLLEQTRQELDGVVAVSVIDRTGGKILRGDVLPYASPKPPIE